MTNLHIYLVISFLLLGAACSGTDSSTGNNTMDSDADTDADSDADSDTDGDTDTDSDADTDSDSDGDTDADSDADTDTDSDSDMDSDTDTDTDTDTDSDTDIDSDTRPSTDSDEDTASDETDDSLTIEEFGDGFCRLDGAVEINNGGFNGSGYANSDNSEGSGIVWQIDAASPVDVNLHWRYASTSDRPAMLSINDDKARVLTFPSSGDWATWSEMTAAVTLSAGSNAVRLAASSDEGLANIDNLTVRGAGIAAGICVADPARDITVEPPFASHMVLQRNRIIPVWGTASGEGKVTVTIGGQTRDGMAVGNGKWRVELEPMDAGGPYSMRIEGTNTVELEDVYVGEVWQAAGQSNMDTRLSFYDNLSDTIAAANHPLMRYFTVRQPGNPPTTWEVVSPATAGDLSATAYFFGKEILESTDVAIGLVVTAVGGTTIASWLDPATIAGNREIVTDDIGTMWNEWVSPVVGYGIRGTIWIQGEQNCNATDAPGYGDIFQLLITGWRNIWGQGDFPFYFGQLSNIHDLQNDPNNASYVAMVREGQRLALALPDTAMSVNMDIGTAGNWHFPDKPEAGRRLSLPARALVYGESEMVYSGPLYRSSVISGNEVTLYFDHVGDGLKSVDGGALTGFAITDSSGMWKWGQAEIRDDTVVVSANGISTPTAVRYAWGDNPVFSLYNRDGLPASAFTTESHD